MLCVSVRPLNISGIPLPFISQLSASIHAAAQPQKDRIWSRYFLLNTHFFLSQPAALNHNVTIESLVVCYQWTKEAWVLGSDRAREENKQLHKWWSGQRKTEKGSHCWLALLMATQCPLSRLCVFFFLPGHFLFSFFLFFFLVCVQNWVSHILSKYIFQKLKVHDVALCKRWSSHPEIKSLKSVFVWHDIIWKMGAGSVSTLSMR